MQRLISADVLVESIYEEFDDVCVWDESGHRTAIEFESIVDAQPTIPVVPEKALRKAAKKLAYIHQRIDLYGDRDDLHDEDYWYEYLLDEEWEDQDIA